MIQPPPYPPRQPSLADLLRFIQSGGLERAASDFVRASLDAVAELKSAAERRAAQWVADGGPQRLGDGFVAFGEQLEASADYAKTNTKWRYLADQMGGVEGATLMFALTGRDAGARPETLNAAQRRLASISGSAVVPAIATFIGDAQVLSELEGHVRKAELWDGSRRQLSKGLEHVGASEYDLACPQLFSGLEGAFWKVGRDRGLVAPSPAGAGTMVFARGKRNHEVVAGLGHLVDGMCGEQLIDAGLAAFLKELVYGGPGHPYRHGNAEDGWQERALLLVGAAAGWLAHFGEEPDPDLLRKVIDHCKERLRAEAEAEKAVREADVDSSDRRAA